MSYTQEVVEAKHQQCYNPIRAIKYKWLSDLIRGASQPWPLGHKKSAKMSVL